MPHEYAEVCIDRCAETHLSIARERAQAAPPTRRNGSQLQRSAPREFAQQKLHEEQQPAEADAADAG
jgi:hypothetical protein